MSSLLLLPVFTYAQNVGVGTGTPTGRLQVNALSTTNKPSISVVDSSGNSGGIIKMRSLNNVRGMSLSEYSAGEYNSNQYLDIKSDTAYVATFRGNGRVGINNTEPAFALDVAGDINTANMLRVNGNGGTEGQVLTSNGNGTMSWKGKEKFSRFKSFRYEGNDVSAGAVWEIPAGVQVVGVEIWSGGGQAVLSGSGASGGYIYAEIPVSSLYTQLIVFVGAGGGRCPSCYDNGYSSGVTMGGSPVLYLAARGGYNTSFSSGSIRRGTFNASGTYLSQVSYYSIEGGSAKFAEESYQHTNAIDYIFYKNADGGDAPLRPGSGGKTGWRKNTNGSFFTQTGEDGGEPGGGGGFPNGLGGHGQVIIYW